MTVQLNLEDGNVEQHFLSPDIRIHNYPPSPPVKIHQKPEKPVNTRVVKRKWGDELLLYEGAKKLFLFGETGFKQCRDMTGIIGFENPNMILVARDYIWKESDKSYEKFRNRVSVHERLFDRALRHNKPIVMYISLKNWFMKLNIKWILEDNETNYNIRGKGSSQRMVNFNIYLGERVFLPQTKLEVKI